MKKLILILIFISPLFAQQKQPVASLQEDCGAIFQFTVASSGAQAAGNTTSGSPGTTVVIDNSTAGCLDWTVSYTVTSGVSALSLVFQTAPSVAGVPGTWGNYPGTLSSGINPNTAATTGGAVTIATGVEYNFLRMNLTNLTGTGVVSGKLQGWKRRPPSSGGGSGGSGCVGTSVTPCVVDGPTAAGSAPTFPPVLIAGQDGAPGLIRVILTDANGRAQINVAQWAGTAALNGGVAGSVGVGGLAANAAANAGNPVKIGGPFNTTQPTVTNGQVVDAQFTARGAQIVATGVDPFNVVVSSGGGCVGTVGTPCVVQGPAADGAAVAGNPVRIGGKDGSGNTQDILTDTRGDTLVVVDGNPTVASGQQSVTTSAVALATTTVRGVCVKAFRGNTVNVYIGASGVTTSTGQELGPGDAQCTPVTNTNLVFVIAPSGGASVSWFATAP